MRDEERFRGIYRGSSLVEGIPIDLLHDILYKIRIHFFFSLS